MKRITIETPNIHESQRLADRISHLVSSTVVGDKAISFVPNEGTDLLAIANLLSTRSENEHIDLAMQWLRNPGSVAQSTLEASERRAATTANEAAEPGQAGKAKREMARAAHGAITHAARGKAYRADVMVYVKQYLDLEAARPVKALAPKDDITRVTACPCTKSVSPIIDNLQRDHDSFRPSDLRRVTACPGVIRPTQPVDCNLATKIAWLEGLSVVSECTGERYCLVGTDRVKYDPIGRGAIIAELIQKYKVDLDWRPDGRCELAIYRWDHLGEHRTAPESTSDHNGCFSTTVLTVILEAQKS